MPKDDSYKSNEMDASTVGNGVDDRCTKSIMDANSMCNAKHSNFYRSYVMDVSSVSNIMDASPSPMLRMTVPEDEKDANLVSNA